MSRFWKRSMGLMAVVALAGCGGPAAEESEDTLMQNGQELKQCGVDLPPCGTGWYCDTGTSGGTRGVCRPAPID
ncbi:hypothetical protein [Vitiosangium sp. GDMCC 1.1324]|uniref:hypothetical protein n=1 Tax=Vitiosangium sp. (strain GDMCC 1.1324) TaxID=2138576 RepID=UPI000D3A0A8E|nr:hypothetical protein [Vitiosangium sp. GDMCC 1.1324]PTL75938.1 hypothetical protein DAT35_52625 [Vitiosangium sp. GDMCC 1.1324]